MVLQVHAWGSGFGLPSIDPECLAVITYLAYASPPPDSWTLIASSPSAVPGCKSHVPLTTTSSKHANLQLDVLPALYDTQTQSWTTGFSDIVAYLRGFASKADLDKHLTPIQLADSTAYSDFLRSNAAALVALSLYVSSANWADTTRPA